jgi:hypothetical protein
MGRSYNDLAGRNGSGLCGDATMLRDSPGGRIDALKIPARRVEYSLTESALFPFQAEPTQVHKANTLM